MKICITPGIVVICVLQNDAFLSIHAYLKLLHLSVIYHFFRLSNPITKILYWKDDQISYIILAKDPTEDTPLWIVHLH